MNRDGIKVYLNSVWINIFDNNNTQNSFSRMASVDCKKREFKLKHMTLVYISISF